MSREEYIAELRRNLHELPTEEQNSAVQYYVDYFDDAGAENEQEVIDRLGSPARVAETIKSDYRSQTQGTPPPQSAPAQTNKVLLIILAILSSPIWAPLLIAAAAVMIAMFIAVFAVLCAMVVVAFLLVVTGGIVFGSGLFTIGLAPAVAALSVGWGFVMFGIGLAATVFMLWLAVKALPAVIRLFVKLCSLPFKRRSV